MKPQKKIHSSPFVLAICYAIAATLSSVALALIQGQLFSKTIVAIGNTKITIYPLINNFSTLIDFTLLNPAVIYFLQSSFRSINKVYIKTGRGNPIPPYHRYGLLVLSAVIGTTAMLYYYMGFMVGDYFDAIISVDSAGNPIITLLGWAVFFWTTLFIIFVIYRASDQFAYVIFILTLSEKDLSYKPYHPDESAGIRKYIQPSILFFRAMVVLLLTFVAFSIQDKLLFYIDESNRLWGLVAYFCVSAPLFFLPLFHLHKLMINCRQKYLAEINQIIDPLIKKYPLTDMSIEQSIELKEHLSFMESLEKYRRLLSSFPIWPLPRRSLIEPLSILAGAAMPIVHKVILLAAKQIGL